MVEMKRGNKPRRPRRTTGIAPFRDHETILACSESASTQERRADGRIHLIFTKPELVRQCANEKVRSDITESSPPTRPAILQTHSQISPAAPAPQTAAPNPTAPP